MPYYSPSLAKLAGGRIVVIIRGANYHDPNWPKQRTEPGTPAVKWYAWSDDNGRTFTDPMPWHFDDGEIVYSSVIRYMDDTYNTTPNMYYFLKRAESLQREVVTIECYSSDVQIRRMVLQYNRMQSDQFVKLVSYGDHRQGEESLQK